MNVAIVHPYPLRARSVGGVIRVCELARHLARRHRVTVFTHETSAPATLDPDLDALGIVQHGCSPPRASWGAKLRNCLAAAPYYVRYNANPALASALARADAHRPFDVVHLEFGYMQPALAGIGEGAVRVLAEQEAMPFVVDGLRQVPWRDRTPYEQLAVLAAGKVKRFDRLTLPTFDLLYGITPRERDYLAKAAGRPARLLPHVVRADRFAGIEPPHAVDPVVLFVGNFVHRPNVYAVQWFVRHAWPRVRAVVPGAAFHVVGGGLPADARASLDVPGVVLRGYVDDLVSCYQAATVTIAPVFSGGGMRGKVLEAGAAARPVVATAAGLDGVALTPGRDCMSAEEPGAFAAAVVGYLRDTSRRVTHGIAARALIRSTYDAPVVFARLERDYEQAVRERTTTRRKAFA